MSHTSPTSTSARSPPASDERNAPASAANFSRASTKSLVWGSAASSLAIMRFAVNAGNPVSNATSRRSSANRPVVASCFGLCATRIGPNFCSMSATTRSTSRASASRSPWFSITQVAAASLSASGACASDPLRRFVDRQPVARDEPRLLDLRRRGDDDQAGEAGLRAVLDEQRRFVEHDARARVRTRRDRRRTRRGDPRMRDATEVRARGRIGERDRAQPLAIELAVGREDRGAEPRDQLGERRLPGLDDLPREQVRIDDGRTALRQHARHRALARRDPAGQPDHVHRHERCLPCGAAAAVASPRMLGKVLASLAALALVALLVRERAAGAARRDWTGQRRVRDVPSQGARGLAGDPPRADARSVCRRAPSRAASRATGRARRPRGLRSRSRSAARRATAPARRYAPDDVMRDPPGRAGRSASRTCRHQKRAPRCARSATHAPTRGTPFDPDRQPVHPVKP